MPRPGARLRLIDVAERAGVSLATASRALARREGVSEEVADRVPQVSRELGYVANPYARTLAGGASSTVGLIVHQIDDPYFSETPGASSRWPPTKGCWSRSRTPAATRSTSCASCAT